MKILYSSHISFAQNVFRLCAPIYANARDAISGDGAFYAAGRFHEKGAFRIVYTGTSLEQALDEYFHTAARAGFATEDLLPITAFAIDLQLSRVLDLTDEAVRDSLGVTLDQLLTDDYAIPQRVGQMAFDGGFEAILAPSRRGEPNLNVLVENLLPGSTFKILNPDKLPPVP